MRGFGYLFIYIYLSSTTDCHSIILCSFERFLYRAPKYTPQPENVCNSLGALHLKSIDKGGKDEVTVNNFGTLCHVNIANITLPYFCSASNHPRTSSTAYSLNTKFLSA